MKTLKIFIACLCFGAISGSAFGQIHYSGRSHIEINGGATIYATPYGNLSYVRNFNNKQYAKVGVSYFRNTIKVLGNKEYSDVIHLEIPYFFNLAGTQKLYLNIGLGLDAGYEIAPNLDKYRSNEVLIKNYDNRAVFGGAAILECEYYLGARCAIVGNVKASYLSSKITNFNTFFTVGLKILL